jgi:dihydroxyacid dehydratase/phosphogluconate dehydratase
VPEVMLHLREMGTLNLDVITVTGEKLSTILDWWAESERRQAVKRHLLQVDHVTPDQIIMDANTAVRSGLRSTMVFPVGNIAPQGAVIKSTAIDPSVVDEEDVYRHRGPARVFFSEVSAIAAIKGLTDHPVKPGDVVVLVGIGPSGTGMEETYQVTSALKFLPWGNTVALLTDARFSGVSTGACIGHIGPEGLAGGPIGKIRDGDVIEIIIDRKRLSGSINLVATPDGELTDITARELLNSRRPHPQLAPHPALPDDTKLWAALQFASGGTWSGCVYDAGKINEVIMAGMSALKEVDRC